VIAPGQLLAAMDAVDAAGGRMTVAAGRLRVDVEVELPEWVWAELRAHRHELVACLAGGRPIWTDDEPIWRDLGREELPPPAGVDACDRCSSKETRDQEIHEGRSTRRDCAVCGRFRKFVVWYGSPMP
jgi:hypothetical protein